LIRINRIRPVALLAAIGVVAGIVVSMAATAEELCGVCARAIRTNSALASCFLEEYSTIASRSNGAVIVDLSKCAKDRGVVLELPTPTPQAEAPDLQFILSRVQLGCLKRKLEEPDLVLDPLARIELDRCG
jgi:hypothetical protein